MLKLDNGLQEFLAKLNSPKESVRTTSNPAVQKEILEALTSSEGQSREALINQQKEDILALEEEYIKGSSIPKAGDISSINQMIENARQENFSLEYIKGLEDFKELINNLVKIRSGIGYIKMYLQSMKLAYEQQNNLQITYKEDLNEIERSLVETLNILDSINKLLGDSGSRFYKPLLEVLNDTINLVSNIESISLSNSYNKIVEIRDFFQNRIKQFGL